MPDPKVFYGPVRKAAPSQDDSQSETDVEDSHPKQFKRLHRRTDSDDPRATKRPEPDLLRRDRLGSRSRSSIDITSHTGQREILRRAKAGDLPYVTEALQLGWHPSAKALLLATKGGHSEMVSILLAFGASPDGQADGSTPLAEALVHSREACVSLFLNAGVSLNWRDSDGKSYRELAEKSSPAVRALLADAYAKKREQKEERRKKLQQRRTSEKRDKIVAPRVRPQSADDRRMSDVRKPSDGATARKTSEDATLRREDRKASDASLKREDRKVSDASKREDRKASDASLKREDRKASDASIKPRPEPDHDKKDLNKVPSKTKISFADYKNLKFRKEKDIKKAAAEKEAQAEAESKPEPDAVIPKTNGSESAVIDTPPVESASDGGNVKALDLNDGVGKPGHVDSPAEPLKPAFEASGHRNGHVGTRSPASPAPHSPVHPIRDTTHSPHSPIGRVNGYPRVDRQSPNISPRNSPQSKPVDPAVASLLAKREKEREARKAHILEMLEDEERRRKASFKRPTSREPSQEPVESPKAPPTPAVEEHQPPNAEELEVTVGKLPWIARILAHDPEPQRQVLPLLAHQFSGSGPADFRQEPFRFHIVDLQVGAYLGMPGLHTQHPNLSKLLVSRTEKERMWNLASGWVCGPFPSAEVLDQERSKFLEMPLFWLRGDEVLALTSPDVPVSPIALAPDSQPNGQAAGTKDDDDFLEACRQLPIKLATRLRFRQKMFTW